MYGNASSPRHKADDLIARDRAAAFGKTHGNVIDSLDYDPALASDLNFLFLLGIGYILQNLFVGQDLRMILLIQLLHFIDNLAFL